MRRRWYLIGWAALFIASIGWIYTGPFRSRLHVYTVLSSSMEPSIRKGSVIVSLAEPSFSYREHDIITFMVPGRQVTYVTHRIERIQLPHGQVPMEIFTKGDANTNGDSWVLSPGNIQGKEVVAIPLVGYVFYALHTVYGFVGVGLLIFLWLVVPSCITLFESEEGRVA